MSMQTIIIILGVLILISTFLDFFHSTLSGNGFGIISAGVNAALGKLILKDKSKLFFKFSGLAHVLFTALTWLFLMLLGVYVILISSEMMVINTGNHLPASYVERFYYMCYVVSTMGNGDFMPGNSLSRVFTGIFSFLGLILLTTALTYFLSVIKAVLQKKQLALYISSMGENVADLYKFLGPAENMKLLAENSRQLKMMIIQASSAYIFFPIIQYFLTNKKRASAELQLARLNEVLVVLQNHYEKNSFEYERVFSLQKAITYYLALGLDDQKDYTYPKEDVEKERSFWAKYNQSYTLNPDIDHSMHAAICGAGWTWKDVYESDENEIK